VLHQVGQINDYPVIFRKIYMNPDIYPDEIVFDNVIEHTKTLFSAEDIELESKLIVVNLPELESAYLDLDAGSPGYYFRTMITHQKKGIAFVKTYFSGEYTVWRHHPETIRF
jgi:DNA-binding GntR family transcriptional regulator